jgi:serine/threonine protein kinase
MTTTELCQATQPRRSISQVFGPGAVVDSRYEVLRPIGRGSRREVVEARHLQTGRAVVVKLLRRDEKSRGEGVKEIGREARALGAVDHPGVATIFDAGICKVNGPFLVLEKLDGRSLEGLLAARGALDVDSALAIFRRLALALAEVHRRGYVHRDLKPGNVFIASSRIGGEVVKLLDFAHVADIGATSHQPLALVADGGVEDQRAPEQLENPLVADPRSDLFSLGVIVAMCLGVEREQLGSTWRERQRGHALLGHRSDIPDAVLELLDELLSVAPSARPHSAESVVARLDGLGERPIRILRYALWADAETGGRPTTAPPPAPEHARRRRLRAPYITPVRILGDDDQIDGRTEDISSTGLLVVALGAVELKGVRTVRFALPTTGRVVAVKVEPKWSRQRSGRTAIGLEFIDIDPVAAEAIESYARYVAVER